MMVLEDIQPKFSPELQQSLPTNQGSKLHDPVEGLIMWKFIRYLSPLLGIW